MPIEFRSLNDLINLRFVMKLLCSFLVFCFGFEVESATTGSVSIQEVITMFDSSVTNSIRNNARSGIGCNFDITQLEEEEPLFLSYPDGKQLIIPENGVISLQPSQGIIADCLGTVIDSACKFQNKTLKLKLKIHFQFLCRNLTSEILKLLFVSEIITAKKTSSLSTDVSTVKVTSKDA